MPRLIRRVRGGRRARGGLEAAERAVARRVGQGTARYRSQLAVDVSLIRSLVRLEQHAMAARALQEHRATLAAYAEDVRSALRPDPPARRAARLAGPDPLRGWGRPSA